VDYVARQLGLAEGEARRFEVTGRTAERNRTQIREAPGFRVFARGDEDKMVTWLAEQVCPSELNEDRHSRIRGESDHGAARRDRKPAYRRPASRWHPRGRDAAAGW
jgi:Domain of unknown function (DUF4158)